MAAAELHCLALYNRSSQCSKTLCNCKILQVSVYLHFLLEYFQLEAFWPY